MKITFLTSVLVLLAFINCSSPSALPPLASEITGAWKLESQNGVKATNEVALLIKDGYIFYTEYRVSDKHFEGSLGGQYTYDKGAFNYVIEFDTWIKERIGSTIESNVELENGELKVHQLVAGEASTMIFSRMDDGTGDLAGAWRITDRMRNGEMQAMRQGPRKTIKMITGTRFQWAAFNPETAQFSGTGGGSIVLEDGKYTERIEFFSRNKDRVGAELTFDYAVEGTKWDHSGLSSSGNPIREIWTRQNQ